jgi:hypothetical protein
MIENYRTGSVWKRFMQNADVQRGLKVMGFTTVTSVKSPPGQSAEFRLEQNYPNPFNPTTVVSWQQPVVSSVKLAIYDLLGREVAVLVDGVLEPGKHSVPWNASGLASGVYTCRIEAGGFVVAKKMMLIK